MVSSTVNMKITTVNDYYEELQKKFPTLSLSDIKRIVTYGWRQLYLHNSYGCDTLVKTKNLWCYIGNLKKNALEHFKYYRKKLAAKIRIVYKRKKIQWDGYYYFALTEPQYQEYLSQNKKLGRRKKHYKFSNVLLYQILDECKVSESSHPYIFRIPYISSLGNKLFLKELTTDKAELIIQRDPLKFKDLFVCYNNYEFL